ncbi:MAG: hypothetical protein FH748_16535 [Balneolaceae bacterium]|nr:hypothetical protein [Balneolaceae bacterium]
MKIFKWMFCLGIMLMLPAVIVAQTMDLSELKALEEGNYSFAKGKVQVTLTDTTTPAFVMRDFKQQGYEVSSINIKPIVGFGTAEVEESVITELEEHPYIKNLIVHKQAFTSADREKIMEMENASKERKEKLVEELTAMSKKSRMQVIFNINITKTKAHELLDRYPAISVTLLNDDSPRTVIVKTPEGRETQMMDKLEKIPYVESTAMIGVIDQNRR